MLLQQDNIIDQGEVQLNDDINKVYDLNDLLGTPIQQDKSHRIVAIIGEHGVQYGVFNTSSKKLTLTHYEEGFINQQALSLRLLSDITAVRKRQVADFVVITKATFKDGEQQNQYYRLSFELINILKVEQAVVSREQGAQGTKGKLKP